MSKKFTVACLSMLVLFAVCGFSLKSGATKATAGNIKVKTHFMGESPVRVLGAWSNAEGLIVDVHNTSDVAVEFIEIETERYLERLGKGGLFENQLNPDAPDFRLGPNTTRLLRFPRIKNYDGGIEIRVVLLVDGTGWFKGWILKRLDKVDKDGRLWNIDREANKKLLQLRSSAIPILHSFMPAKKQPQCYFAGFVVQAPCGVQCTIQDVTYVPEAQGVQVDFFTQGNCYNPFFCGTTNVAREVGTCP